MRASANAQFGPTQPSRRPFAHSAMEGSGRVCLGRLRPVLRPWRGTRGPLGAIKEQPQTGAQRVSQQGADEPAACECVTLAQVEGLFGRRNHAAPR